MNPSWSFVALALAALVGLGLSLMEWGRAKADNDWRRKNELNGVGALVAANAVEQETARSGRMLLYLAAVGMALTGWIPPEQRALFTIAAVLLDAWTAARKARLRRALRASELAHLGVVVTLDKEGA